MTCCPTCGRPDAADIVQRGPLRVEDQPPAVFWRGRRLSIRGAKLRILRTLVRFGAAGHGLLEMHFIDVADARRTIGVHIHQMRSILNEETGG